MRTLPGGTLRWVAATAALTLLVAGCAGADEPAPPASEDAGTPAAADETEPSAESTEPEEVEPVLSVVATVAPLADLVARVGGERVQVSSLVPPGADSHTYEPRPGDVAILSEADAYLGIGLALNDGALRLAEETLPPGAAVVRLGEEVLGAAELVFDHHPHDHEHDHSHGHSHSHSHDGELGPNPHVWTSVRNAAALVEGIATSLSELDPAGAAGYAERAAAVRAELDELDEQITTATATIPAGNRTLVTYHDAWGYFARDYDLAVVTAVQPSDFSEPSAAEVRAVIDLVREHDVPAVFGSEVFPSRVLEAIAEETGASYVADLADDVLPGRPGDADHSYVGLMRRNATTIVAALGGDVTALDG